MHNIDLYRTDLLIYIAVIFLVALVIFAVGNLGFCILKISRVFYEKKVWIVANLAGVLILSASVFPAILDISQSSYCIITNVVNIEVEYKANNSNKYVLITDQNGVVYTCYDFLIDTESLKNVDFPGTVVYAKHSKLMLDYYANSR